MVHVTAVYNLITLYFPFIDSYLVNQGSLVNCGMLQVVNCLINYDIPNLQTSKKTQISKIVYKLTC